MLIAVFFVIYPFIAASALWGIAEELWREIARRP